MALLADLSQLLSKDTWGLVAFGGVVVGLMLAFRRIFPDDRPRQ
jgi:hypothetical protein